MPSQLSTSTCRTTYRPATWAKFALPLIGIAVRTVVSSMFQTLEKERRWSLNSKKI
jgi:hypothetical protein